MRGRKRGALLLGATMFLAAGSLAAQSWRGAAGLEIRVSSRKKGPVSNAVVELEYRGGPGEVGPPPVATDAKGRALVVGLANGTWQVEVQHPDFMSFVAVVVLDSRGKPQITASFLQASSTQSTPIQVKLLRAKGGTPSPPLRLAARPQPQVVEPVRTPEPRPAAEPKAPEAELDKVPQIAEPTVVAPIREVKAPEPVAPAPEALVPEVPAPETPAPKITAPAKPAPQMAQPEPEAPVAAPEPAPQPPVTEPSPAPGLTPQPVEPEPVQEPPAPQPAPEPLPEPPAIEPEPAETEPVEPPVSPKVPVVELQPPAPESSQPVPAPPTTVGRPAATLVPTPAAVATLEPEPEPPAKSPALTIRPRAPRMAAPEWRSYRHRTCPECRPGEWAVSVAAALAGNGTCSADVRDGVAKALAMLGGRGALELTGFAGGLSAAAGVVGATADNVRTNVAAAGAGGCRVLAVVLPKASRFVGFQFEIDGSDGRRPCLPDQPCPGGTARFVGPPKIARGAAATVIHALAHGSSGEALMTVFFRAPNSNWTP